jgi:aspartate/glutamate racemase
LKPLAKEVKGRKMQSVALFGTKSMTNGFYNNVASNMELILSYLIRRNRIIFILNI